MSHSLAAIIVVVLALAAVLVAVKTVLSRDNRKPQNCPYEKAPALFSPAELSFLGVLEQACEGKYRFMGKVRLADLVQVRAGIDRGDRRGAFNRIKSKHVDMVACDPATLAVRFVVELDDKTHGRRDREDRDRFVDDVLQTAGIPVFHFTAQRGYSVREIQAELSKVTASDKG
jgi:hypothetical protein